jgi:hypothetical protein
MWNVSAAPKTVKATRKLAEEFRAMDPCPHDRPLSERRLLVYERMMLAGQFRPIEWSKAYCVETGGTYRVNGKHTSTLLSTIEKIPEGLFITISEYRCETLADVAALYSTFDSAMGARKVSDINAAFAGTLPSLAEVPLRTVSAVVGGIAYFSHQDSYTTLTATERAEALLDNEEFCLFAHSLIGPSIQHQGDGAKPAIGRLPVVAAIYGSYCKSPDDALAFWKAVKEETGTSPTCPDRKLAKFLISGGSARNGGMRGPSRYRATTREIFVKCIHAWNAWRRKESTNLNYHKQADVPSVA